MYGEYTLFETKILCAGFCELFTKVLDAVLLFLGGC
jgi:hypothetical protein